MMVMLSPGLDTYDRQSRLAFGGWQAYTMHYARHFGEWLIHSLPLLKMIG